VRHTNRYPNRIANLDILTTTSTVLGVSLGLAMGYYRPLYNLFEPLV
jgi:ABC-type microcin C transport system permease subunit YejE